MTPNGMSHDRKSLARGVLVFLGLLFVLPRAQAQTIALDNWQFLPDPSGSLTVRDLAGVVGWRAARAGLSWNAQFADLRDYMGVAWYRTTVMVPRFEEKRHILLRFDAVDYLAEVFVNGKLVGSHEGGYTPFHFDITEAAPPGRVEVAVRVTDPPMDEKEGRARFPELLYNEIPHGKQHWYVQTGGLWQPVSVEFRPHLYIERVKVTPSVEGEVAVEVQLAGKEIVSPSPIAVMVHDPSGRLEFQTGGGGITTSLKRTFTGKVREPQLWSPENPALYSVEVTVAGFSGDTWRGRFGFRKFKARAGKLYLNGEPFYMLGALDQDFYPEAIYSTPSPEYLRSMMLKGKQLGLNLLRCHIKVCDPAYLDAADEVGLLVWYEIPSWNDTHHFTAQAAARGEKIFAEMVERDWNHPSIVIQSIMNESWGIDLRQAEQRAWLKAAFDRARTLTAPRGILLVDNSACCEGFHVKTDLDDFHQYFSIPDHHEKWDQWVADFSSRPRWSFSPYGDAERTGAEPLIVSEFGNWGLPRLPAQLPWWFDRDFGGRDVTRPAGVFDRFREFGFHRIFSDFNSLAEATQWHQFRSLKHEIEEMRRHASIQGYVITEFTDINWEVNGLMDMWRNPKAYARALAQIQQPSTVMARLSRRNYWAGEKVEAELLVSHYGGHDLRGATIRWFTYAGPSGSVALGREVIRGSVESVGAITFAAPQDSMPVNERLRIELRDKAGTLVAENSYDLIYYPRPAPVSAPLVFHDPAATAPDLAHALAEAGYKVAAIGNVPDASVLLIATEVDGRVLDHWRAGGRALLLLDSETALPANAPVKVKARAGSDYDGNWVTNFNWVRTDAGPFTSLPFGALLGFEAAAVTPRHILLGLEAKNYGDVHSGIFYGWLNRNSALSLGMKVSAGRALVTTFRFPQYGSDAYATHLLDAMIRHANSPLFTPSLEWPDAPGTGGQP